MTKEEALSQLKVVVLGLEYSTVQNQLNLINSAQIDADNRISISVLVRIVQKCEINDKLYLFIAKKELDNSCRMFPVAEIYLNPSEHSTEGLYDAPIINSGRLAADEYHIRQNCRYNLASIPNIEAGTYAIVVSTKKNNVKNMLDAYYFEAES